MKKHDNDTLDQFGTNGLLLNLLVLGLAMYACIACVLVVLL